MTTSIFFNSIVKETAKAVLVSVNVYFNANAPKAREMWMPKSVIVSQTESLLEVKSWFIEKQMNENAFHGYRMNFETPVNF